MLVMSGSGVGGWMASDWRYTPIFVMGAMTFLVLGAVISVYLLIASYGSRAALKALFGLSIFAYLIEGVGVQTGFPYGPFQYVGGLGPLVLGVPILLPLAWVPLMLGAWQIAKNITKTVVATILVSSWILVAIDLVLDPGAVSLGLWKYAVDGAYYFVPWTNFAGWMLSGSLGAWITTHLLQTSKGSLAYWCLPLASSLGFWSMVNIRTGSATPTLIGAALLIGLTYFVWRDERTHVC